MPASDLAPATIINKETNETIECKFRPKEYTFQKQNQWNQGRATGHNAPRMEFSGGNPMTLQMELFFDTYEQRQDVRRQYTDKLAKLMMVADSTRDTRTRKARPPKCEFRWGNMWSFIAVVTSMTQKYTLFLPDGTPVRATVNVTFMQIEEEGNYPGQNPTSGGTPGNKMRVVKEGDTIDWIAHAEYGDPARWRHIADANNLSNPMDLPPGQVLAIPPLP